MHLRPEAQVYDCTKRKQENQLNFCVTESNIKTSNMGFSSSLHPPKPPTKCMCTKKKVIHTLIPLPSNLQMYSINLFEMSTLVSIIEVGLYNSIE